MREYALVCFLAAVSLVSAYVLKQSELNTSPHILNQYEFAVFGAPSLEGEYQKLLIQERVFQAQLQLFSERVWGVVPVPYAKPDRSSIEHPATAWLSEQESHNVKDGLCNNEVACLAITLWWENRSSREAMCDVAWVILNRMQHPEFPTSVQEVVVQSEPVLQFAFVQDGASDQPNIENPLEQAAWEAAWEVAESALSQEGECARSQVAMATFFQPLDGANDPWWEDALRVVVENRYGHTFYVPRS